MDALLLIKLVRSYPHIYDFKNKDFKNHKLKEISWQTIAKTLDESVDDCKRFWTNLRNKYATEKRKCVQMGIAKPESQAWEFFYVMSFLNDHMKPRRYNFKNKYQKQSPSGFQSDPEIGDIQEESQCHTQELVESILVQKRKINDSVDQLEYDLHNRSQEPYVSYETKTRPSTPNRSIPNGNRCGPSDDKLTTSKENSSIAFGQYVGLRLDGMPEQERRNKKIRICQILEEYE